MKGFDIDEKINRESLPIAAGQLWSILSEKIHYLPQNDQDFVHLAFEIMLEKHAEQRRKSGNFYIIHPVSATITLTNIHLDKETLAACLLHDVPEDTYKDSTEGVKMIQKELGPEVAFLVSGVTKLSIIKYRGEIRHAENLRKLFVAMSEDLRIIFIKLADRLHNLKTLSSLRPDKAQRIALESLEIYAPISERLGMSSFRSQIEDLAFPFAYPEEFRKLKKISDLTINKMSRQVTALQQETEEILKIQKIPYKEILGRAKKYYSIYRKMKLDNKTIEKIYDLIALRVITDSIGNCYHMMSCMHNYFEVIESRTKDYIETPKENGYQSIHLTVKDKKTKTIFEFQFRTQRMHDFAEFGVASHWAYKDDLEDKNESFLGQDSFSWIQQLVDLGKKELTAQDYIKHLKLNIFPDRIFVLTPKGDAIDLPVGATCLDFAFKIHEFIGAHAFMAKINDKVVKLNEVLQNGDVVEILTSKKQRPTIDWLNWVKSVSAAKSIRNILRGIGLGK